MRDILAGFIGSLLTNLDNGDPEVMKIEVEDLLQALSAVVGQLTVETYPPETRLCEQGANEDCFYIIARGQVAIWRQHGETSETRELIAHKNAGEFFGEMALILNAPRSADVITTQESVMLELNRRAFKKSLRISKRLADLLAQQTIKQLDENWHKDQEAQGKKSAPPFQLFTSYSSQDVVWVRELIGGLQKDLEDNNVTLWMDKLHIKPGEKWDRAVKNGLDSSHAMLLVLSERSVESENVADEWSYYREKGKPIIPVLMERCEPDYRLMRYQYIDFAKEQYADALAQVHARILELASNRS